MSKQSKTESQKSKEDWMNSKWRPAMGWMYMTVCIFDFIVFPILWAVIQFWESSVANDAFRQWNPLTLQGAGLFHMAMGAVLGIAAFGRTKEKIEGANNGGLDVAMPAIVPVPATTPITAVPAAPVVSSNPVVPTTVVTAPAVPANTFTSSGKKIVPQEPAPEI